MHEFLTFIECVILACGLLFSISYTLVFTLNVILNKHTPFYKDLLEFVKYKKKFKEWLLKEKDK